MGILRFALILCLGLGLLVTPATTRAADLHRYLPDDTELVVSLNIKQVLGSKLGKDQLTETIKALIASSEEVTTTLKDLGLDPLKDLHRLLVTSPGSQEADRGLIILQGEFDPAKFKARGEELVKKQNDLVKLHMLADGQGGQHQIYEFTPTGQQFPWFVSVPARDALLISPGKDYIVDALKKNPLKNPLGLKNKQFQELLEKVDDKQSIYLAGTSEALGRLGLPESFTKDFLQRMDGIAGGLKLEDDLHVELVLGAKTVADARSMHKSINDLHTQGLLILGLLAGGDPNLGTLLDVLKSMRLAQKEKAVSVKARVDAEVLEKLLSGAK